MAAQTKFYCFVADLGLAKHNLNANTFKVALTDVAPVATNTVLANITQIAAGNGYASGGAAVPNNDYDQTTGTATWDGDAVVFTAAGGAIAQFRYVVLYNATAAGGPLVSWADLGSETNLLDGDSLTLKFNASATEGTIMTAA